MPSMVERLSKRFFVHTDKIKNLLEARISDLQYVVDLEDEEGWQCHFRVEPMLKEQWFQHLRYDLGIFSQDTLKDYQESIPENIVYVDLDFYRKDVATKDCAALIKAAQHKSSNAVRERIEYYNKG